MADTTFTILGTTGSGKTCYLLGMYYEMCAGKEGYTLTTDDDRDVRLQRLYDRLSDKSLGADRFPAGTDNMSEYEFNLEYGYEPIMSFKWTDYAGNALRLKNAVKYFADLKKFISSSSSLFICLDGSLLMGNDTRKKIRDVSTKCSRDINKFFSDYRMIHNLYDNLLMDDPYFHDKLKTLVDKQSVARFIMNKTDDYIFEFQGW